ncbi:MAG TPA: SsrA-binding protein [Candidatus Magasanikbacteria bacterium]|nr:SsrA-binding protein [Candidatus Magasanikbacteria bacterium]
MEINNSRARFDYEILDTWEAGLRLTGAEVKAVRAGSMSLKGAYITIHNDEAFLLNAHIGLYAKAIQKGYDPTQSRKLLLHKKEIKRLIGLTQQKGLTLVPLKVYSSHNKLKLEFGLGRGRSRIDKRAVIKKRDIDREIKTAFSS